MTTCAHGIVIANCLLCKTLGRAKSLSTMQNERQPDAPVKTLRIESTNELISLSSSSLWIGSGPNNDLCVNDKSVAQSHCSMVPEAATYWVKPVCDQPTFVNGVQINTKTKIRKGDVIKLGSVALRAE